MTPEERIKVAEFCEIPGIEGVKRHGFHAGWFNPAESADDDYLVLEAMRKHGYAMRISWGARHYQKGDYARALLKVIE